MGTHKPHKKITNRLHRAEGQLHSIERLIREDRPALDILLQLMAVAGSLQNIACCFAENFLLHEILRLKKAERPLTACETQWLETLQQLHKKLCRNPKKELKPVVRSLIKTDPRYSRK